MHSEIPIEKKKIIFVVHSLKGGGAEKVATTLLEALQDSEENIKLVLVLFDRESTKILASTTDVKYLDVHKNGSVIYTIKKFFKVISSLSRIIKQESPCTILSIMDYSNVVSIISNRLSGKKNRVIISVHAPPTAQMRKYAANLWEKIMGLLIKSVYNKADAIVAVSKHIRNDLIENFKIDNSRIQVVNNPVDLNKISALSEEDVSGELFKEDIPIIISVGRLSKEKGGEYLLKAFALLNGKCDARLAILGEGREDANLRKLSINLGIEKKVFFLGFKDNPYKYMKRSTVFVLPSLYEGFGIVIIEAMVCGIPVIATKCYDGIEEIVEHGKTGLLVNVGDEHGMADSIMKLLNDKELRVSLSEGAKKRVVNFSVEKIINQYKAILGI